jgi:hypothetical protein
MEFDNSIVLMTRPYDYGLTMILKKIVCQNQQAVIVFLLIIAGVETNPGPNPPKDSITDVQSSMSD